MQEASSRILGTFTKNYKAGFDKIWRNIQAEDGTFVSTIKICRIQMCLISCNDYANRSTSTPKNALVTVMNIFIATVGLKNSAYSFCMPFSNSLG